MRITLVALISLPCTGVIDPDGPDTGPAPPPGVTPLTIPSSWDVCSPLPTSTARATAVTQEGDELVVELEHAGGCGDEHAFVLCRERAGWQESDPVKTDAVIWHDPAGDGCEALLTDTLRVPLAALYEAYEAAYPVPGRVTVDLDGLTITVDVPAR